MKITVTSLKTDDPAQTKALKEEALRHVGFGKRQAQLQKQRREQLKLSVAKKRFTFRKIIESATHGDLEVVTHVEARSHSVLGERLLIHQTKDEEAVVPTILFRERDFQPVVFSDGTYLTGVDPLTYAPNVSTANRIKLLPPMYQRKGAQSSWGTLEQWISAVENRGELLADTLRIIAGTGLALAPTPDRAFTFATAIQQINGAPVAVSSVTTRLWKYMLTSLTPWFIEKKGASFEDWLVTFNVQYSANLSNFTIALPNGSVASIFGQIVETGLPVFRTFIAQYTLTYTVRELLDRQFGGMTDAENKALIAERQLFIDELNRLRVEEGILDFQTRLDIILATKPNLIVPPYNTGLDISVIAGDKIISIPLAPGVVLKYTLATNIPLSAGAFRVEEKNGAPQKTLVDNVRFWIRTIRISGTSAGNLKPFSARVLIELAVQLDTLADAGATAIAVSTFLPTPVRSPVNIREAVGDPPGFVYGSNNRTFETGTITRFPERFDGPVTIQQSHDQYVALRDPHSSVLGGQRFFLMNFRISFDLATETQERQSFLNRVSQEVLITFKDGLPTKTILRSIPLAVAASNLYTETELDGLTSVQTITLSSGSYPNYQFLNDALVYTGDIFINGFHYAADPAVTSSLFAFFPGSAAFLNEKTPALNMDVALAQFVLPRTQNNSLYHFVYSTATRTSIESNFPVASGYTGVGVFGSGTQGLPVSNRYSLASIDKTNNFGFTLGHESNLAANANLIYPDNWGPRVAAPPFFRTGLLTGASIFQVRDVITPGQTFQQPVQSFSREFQSQQAVFFYLLPAHMNQNLDILGPMPVAQVTDLPLPRGLGRASSGSALGFTMQPWLYSKPRGKSILLQALSTNQMSLLRTEFFMTPEESAAFGAKITSLGPSQFGLNGAYLIEKGLKW